MIMEFDISKMVGKIAMQAKENQEEFIIETIHPYCENILQIKINKEELKQILLNGIQKQQPNVGKWIAHPSTYAHLVCSKCLSNAPYDCKTNYCPNCGAKMIEVENETKRSSCMS